MLPIFSCRKKEDSVPLWRSSSSRPGAKYYEFEVLADEGGDSKDERLENASNLPCHVCGVTVCASHWQHHAQCAAHRANQAIAHTSLTRAQQMALEAPLDSTGDSRSPRTYFCPPCSTAIVLSKRITHDRSEQHSKSVLYGKLLESLASLYENRDNLNSVCTDIFRAITDHENKNAQIQSRVLSEGGGSNILHQKKKNHETEENKEDDLEKKNLMKDEKNDNISTTLTSESRAATKTDPKLAAIEKPDYTVLALSGAKLKVSFDNYHGLSMSGHTTLCRVCRVVVADRDQHARSYGHRTKVRAAVNNKHCIRRLTDTLSHCILCNDLVGSSDEAHVASHAHVAALQRALLRGDVIAASSPDSYTEQLLADNHVDAVHFNERNYFCQVCQIYILKSALLEHVGIEAHRNSLSSFISDQRRRYKAPAMQPGYCNYCKDTFVGMAKEKSHLRSKDHKFNKWLAEKDTKLHFHFKESGYPNEVICQICDVNVSDITQAINKHVNSYDHGTNYNKILKDNHMEVISEYIVICALCNLNLYIIGVLDHTQNECHKKKLMNCNFHGIGSVEFDLIKENPDSNDTNLKQILKTNLICNSRDDKYYSCQLCHRHIEKPLILAHIMSKKHTKLCKPETATNKKVLQKYVKNKEKETTDKLEKEMNDFKNIAHLFDETNEELICILCDVTVENRNDSISNHVKSVKHDNKYKSFLLNNDLKEIVDISLKVVQKYDCKPCGVDVHKSDLFFHVNSEKHKMYLSPQPSTSKCFQHRNVQTEPETEEVKEIKISSNSVDNKPQNDANFINSAVFVSEVVIDNPYCTKMYADGVQHKNNLQLLENPNSETQLQIKVGSALPTEKFKPQIKPLDKIQIALNEPEPLNVQQKQINTTESFSATCKDIFANTDRFKVNKILMKRNVNSCIKNKSCVVCNIEVPNIKEHVNGMLHKQNLQASSNIKEIYDIFQNQLEVAAPGQSLSAEVDIVKEIITMMIVGTHPKIPESNIETFLKEGYCNICNIFIFPNNMSNFNEHVKEKQHEQNLQSSNFKSTANVIQNEIFVKSPQVDIFCHICHVQCFSIREHLEGKKHKVNLTILKERIEAIVKKDNMIDAVVDNFCDIKSVSNFPDVDYICHICNAIVPNTVNNIIQHVESSKHNVKVELLTAYINNIVDSIVDVSTSFEIKNVDAISASKLSGMKAKENEVKQVIAIRTTSDSITDMDIDSPKTTTIFQATDIMYENNNADNINARDANMFLCSGNNTKTDKDPMTRIGTSVSKAIENEKTKTESYTKIGITFDDYSKNDSPSLITRDDDQEIDDFDEGFYICRFCDRAILANETNIKSHLDSFHHKTNANEKYIKAGILSSTLCDICKEEIKNNPIAKIKHAESEMHKRKFGSLLLDNHIKIRDDKVYYCEVCDSYFSKHSVSSHIKRPQHVTHFK